MVVEVTAGDPYAVGPDLVAAGAGARASELGAPESAVAAADPVAMVYATGAPVRFSDREKIEAILAKAKASNYGVRSILHAVVQSDLFLNK